MVVNVMYSNSTIYGWIVKSVSANSYERAPPPFTITYVGKGDSLPASRNHVAIGTSSCRGAQQYGTR